MTENEEDMVSREAGEQAAKSAEEEAVGESMMSDEDLRKIIKQIFAETGAAITSWRLTKAGQLRINFNDYRFVGREAENRKAEQLLTEKFGLPWTAQGCEQNWGRNASESYLVWDCGGLRK